MDVVDNLGDRGGDGPRLRPAAVRDGSDDEDKTYTVTPASVTVKAGIVTGEVRR